MQGKWTCDFFLFNLSGPYKDLSSSPHAAVKPYTGEGEKKINQDAINSLEID